jgi:hypothetical protein
MMTGKRQRADNVEHADRSEPNLGQKEAENASEAQLRHIEGSHTGSFHCLVQAGASESLIDGCLRLAP